MASFEDTFLLCDSAKLYFAISLTLLVIQTIVSIFLLRKMTVDKMVVANGIQTIISSFGTILLCVYTASVICKSMGGGFAWAFVCISMVPLFGYFAYFCYAVYKDDTEGALKQCILQKN